MFTDADLDEVFRAAVLLAVAGHDASSEWDRFSVLTEDAAARRPVAGLRAPARGADARTSQTFQPAPA